jgi:putative redox protein
MSVNVKYTSGLQVEVSAGRHTWLGDEPLGVGEDTGPNPYDMLLGALGACKIMTMQMYARRKGWVIDDLNVDLSIRKIHARDCEECESETSMIDLIDTSIQIEGDLTSDQIDRLLQIADRCPVHRTLTSETVIRKVQ